MIQLKDFDYQVDPSRIALEPSQRRSDAKLLVFHRQAQQLTHSQFKNLREFLKPNDLLVFNSSEVIRARFFAQRENAQHIEGLFIKPENAHVYVWLKGTAKTGESLHFRGLRSVQILKRDERGAVLDLASEDFIPWLKTHGQIPLPPYIRKERERQGYPEERKLDQTAYSTIFAEEGQFYSVAAPTASLHFDEELLRDLKAAGIQSSSLKLHVGLGTFEPVEVEDLQQHQMHHELVEISRETQEAIARVKGAGGRVIAVGTTVMRSLESAIRRSDWGKSHLVYETDLFIRPPFEFKIVDGLITNFHWPKSTLLVLVATFLEVQSGSCSNELRHLWRKLYNAAYENDYEFFSYGDGTLIL